MRKTKDKAREVVLMGSIVLLCLGLVALFFYEKLYQQRAYPNVWVGEIYFGGQTAAEIEKYWLERNQIFRDQQFEFRFDREIATISAESLRLGYDATLSATQAILVGRSKHPFSNFYLKFIAKSVNLLPSFRWEGENLDHFLENLSRQIDIPVQDALFSFGRGRVTAFRPSRVGRRVNQDLAKLRFNQTLPTIADNSPGLVTIDLPVETLEPGFTTDQVNSFGIKDLIGRGYSEFKGSITGRVHNVVLAASRLHGLLIKPGEIFSFNKALGDISAATGYQSAYIIKEGRTVLGDGGGVCQVSTTLFRAALAAGLPIVERKAHAYRVHYYEDAGEKPGIDATVFDPTADLKFKNNTPAYILIQAIPNPQKLKLTFELYGAADGRRAEILEHQVWGIAPPPPPLYQDDPTLPKGVTKQVDFEAWGANASFRYRVTRSGEILEDARFVSNFRPWQAVYLKGTQ